MPQDTILFIGAYRALEIKKKLRFRTKHSSIQKLMEKHHLEHIANDNRITTLQEKLDVTADFDYVQESTRFSFKPSNPEEQVESDEDFANQGFYMNLRHAYSLLADAAYFKLEYTFWLRTLLVWIGDTEYQIDAGAFIMNRTLVVAFEMIDVKTGKPLSKDDVGAKSRNYCLVPVNKYRFLDDERETACTANIPNIIAGNIADFFVELTGNKFTFNDYNYVYDIVVLSNDIPNINDYLCQLLGVKQPVSKVKDVSTVRAYEYYPQDGVGIASNYDPENVGMVIYSVLVLESIKLYIYLFQYENLEHENDLRRLAQNYLYLQNLFCSPNIPIETNNLLKYIRGSESYQMHEEGLRVKISYFTAENGRQKNRNNVVLNILLYFISLLGAVATLDTLETHLGLPFCVGLIIVIVIFALGLLWYIREYLNNRHT